MNGSSSRVPKQGVAHKEVSWGEVRGGAGESD